jgi:hypothetical protein
MLDEIRRHLLMAKQSAMADLATAGVVIKDRAAVAAAAASIPSTTTQITWGTRLVASSKTRALVVVECSPTTKAGAVLRSTRTHHSHPVPARRLLQRCLTMEHPR